MDEKTRQQVTWIVIIAVVISLVVFVVYRQVEVDMRLATIATGNSAERLAAVEPLVESQRLAEALEEAPRWVQDRAVNSVMMLGTQRALQQLITAKPMVDAPVAAQIDAYLTQMGETAVGPLVLSMQDRDGAIRGATGGPLRAIGAPAVPSLMPLIDVYDDAVRGLVSSTLGGIGEPAVEPLLQVIRQDRPGPDQGPAAFRRGRNAAIAAFKAMGELAFEPVIDQLLFYDDPQIRLAATDILGTVARGLDEEIAAPVVEPLITLLTTDDAWAVRRRAAEALGGLGDVALHNGAVQPLIAQLGHNRSEVRAAAAEALGAIGDPAAAGPLANLLLTNRVGATVEIARALERIGPPSITPLLPALEAQREVEVRLTATETLATIGTSEAVMPLGIALRDPEPKVRRAAANALRFLADERLLPQLAVALADSEADVYYAARDALARLGAAAIPALLERLGSESTRVAFIAQQALARIGSPAVGPLVRSLASENPQIAQWSAIALGHIGEEAVDPTSAVLNAPAASVSARVAAARALGVSGSYSATRPLQEAAKARPAEVRSAALRAMGRIGDERATDTLIDGLNDRQESVRETAMRVLIDWRYGDVDRKLIEMVEHGDTDPARRAAIVLAKHTPEASGELMRAVGVRDEETPGEDPKVRQLLEQTLQDPQVSDDKREYAIDALRFVGTDSSLDALGPLVRERGPLALPAARAVGQIGMRTGEEAAMEQDLLPGQVELSRAGQLLLAVFDAADDEELRLVAASGISILGAQPVDPLLERLANVSDERRAWIIATLGMIGRPATDRVLDARGREEDQVLSNWMAAALVLIGDARAMDLINQLPDEQKPREDRIEAGREIFTKLAQL